LISTGNDIVALGSVNIERTSEFRFYSKILSASEQALYQQPHLSQIPFAHYVWLLWSVKESAYKYLKKHLPELLFSPTKIIVEDIKEPLTPPDNYGDALHWGSFNDAGEFYTGKVVYGSYVLYFRSKMSREWIASVVSTTEGFENVHWGIRSISHAGHENQSKEARALLLNKLSAFYPGNFSIEKSEAGYPIVLRDDMATQIAASLAHDDVFVAYSTILPAGVN
jgi:phosphopantetheinyl transferase (holo-ACP synthase)